MRSSEGSDLNTDLVLLTNLDGRITESPTPSNGNWSPAVVTRSDLTENLSLHYCATGASRRFMNSRCFPYRLSNPQKKHPGLKMRLFCSLTADGCKYALSRVKEYSFHNIPPL